MNSFDRMLLENAFKNFKEEKRRNLEAAIKEKIKNSAGILEEIYGCEIKIENNYSDYDIFNNYLVPKIKEKEILFEETNRISKLKGYISKIVDEEYTKKPNFWLEVNSISFDLINEIKKGTNNQKIYQNFIGSLVERLLRL